MKIAFIISCINSKSKGNGGHYHSLLTLYKALKTKNELLIINIGTDSSETLNKENIIIYNIISSTLSYSKNKEKLNTILNKESPDVLHAFDHQALFWARIASQKSKTPYCLTKCGGRNPTKYFPYCKNIILYSKENYNYFKNSKKFENSKIQLIPNRVSAFEISDERINQLLKKYPEIQNFEFKFLRICRIGKAYKNSLIQIINLTNKLVKDGYSCCLVIIGVVESNLVLSEIKQMVNTNHTFIASESTYTKNAKELIGFSNFVLGTGRSFMEASSHGKILLSPINDSDIPLLVKRNNINDVLKYNISERLSIRNFNENSNYREIKLILENSKKYKEYSDFSLEIYDNYFNIYQAIQKYKEIYKKIKFDKKIRIIDFFLHFLYLKRSFKQNIDE